jgi:hypothetical protein
MIQRICCVECRDVRGMQLQRGHAEIRTAFIDQAELPHPVPPRTQPSARMGTLWLVMTCHNMWCVSILEWRKDQSRIRSLVPSPSALSAYLLRSTKSYQTSSVDSSPAYLGSQERLAYNGNERGHHRFFKHSAIAICLLLNHVALRRMSWV